MSTISDALKKAQQQRAVRGPERLAPPVETVKRAEPAPKRGEAREPAPTPSVAWLVAVIVVVVLGVSVLVMWWGIGGGGGGREATDYRLQTTDDGLRTGGGEKNGAGGGESTQEAVKAVSVVEEPVLVQEPVGPEPKLVGIFYSEKNPVAIINGFSMKEGESVGGYVVAKILSESVVLKAGAREVVLRLK